MQSSSPEIRPTPVDIVRWVFVLPAALLGSWSIHGAGNVLLSTVGLDLRGPGYPLFLFPLQQLLPSGIVFVLAGAWMAPSRRRAVAIALVVLGISSSWLIHVIAQPAPGLTNFMHATGESLGLAIGTSVAWYLERSRQKETQSSTS